jgi:hypothetical protein
MTGRPQHTQFGTWILDGRGEGRGLRVTRHDELGVINLSLWRHNTCVGTARLLPEDAAVLIGALSEQLVGLGPDAGPSDGDATRVQALEERLARLEEQARTPVWRRTLDRVTQRARASRAPAPAAPEQPAPAVLLTLVP